MELRELALRVLTATDLDEKLRAERRSLTDADPRPVFVPNHPGRPAALAIVPAKQARVPPVAGMGDPCQRVRIVHALANHELQAAELFARAILAFPTAPPEFRAGLGEILGDEMRHTRMYRRRLRALGSELGEFPVSGYFWNKLRRAATPLQFISGMSLTLEHANLDHTIDYARAARDAGDATTARLIEQIHQDEAGHVHFGWRWLARLAPPGEDLWSAYTRNLVWPLSPARARGKAFHRAGRVSAGLGEDFIERIERAEESCRPCPTTHPSPLR